MDVQFESLKLKKLNQINQILNRKFGKSVDFLSLYSVGDYRDDDYSFRIRNQKAFFQISYNEIPYLGAITMSNCEGLNTQELLGINELINMMMGPLLYQEYIQNKEPSFRNSMDKEAESQLETMNLLEFNPIPTLVQPISSQIHFFSQEPGRSLKAALDLHHILNFESFIHYEALQGSLTRAQDFLEMSRITIYVAEVKNLSLKDVDLLVDYSRLVKKYEYKDIPLLITASQIPSEALFSETQISQTQLSELLQYAVNLDRLSLKPALFQESLELLLVK